jgi:kynurenine formamidase
MTDDQTRSYYPHAATSVQTSRTRTRIVDLTHSLEEGMQIYPGDPIFTCRPALTIDADGCSVQQLGMGTHTGTHIDAPSHFFEGAVTVDQISLESLVARPATVVDLRDRFQEEVVEEELLPPAGAGTPDTYDRCSKSNRRRIIEWERDLQPYEAQIKRHRRDAYSHSVDTQGDDSAHVLTTGGCLLLLCTGWDKYWNTPVYLEHPYLSERAAVKLVECGVGVLGVDFLSPDETPSAAASADDIIGSVVAESDLERHTPTGASANAQEAGSGAATSSSDSETHSSFAVHKVILGSGGIIVENLRGLEALLGKDLEVLVTIAPMKIVGGDGSPARAWATIISPSDTVTNTSYEA